MVVYTATEPSSGSGRDASRTTAADASRVATGDASPDVASDASMAVAPVTAAELLILADRFELA
jgi:hypothetical protein